jgi:hypothetical protein
MELVNLRRTVKRFGDVGKIIIAKSELAPYVGKEIVFDLVVHHVTTETDTETVTEKV